MAGWETIQTPLRRFPSGSLSHDLNAVAPGPRRIKFHEKNVLSSAERKFAFDDGDALRRLAGKNVEDVSGRVGGLVVHKILGPYIEVIVGVVTVLRCDLLHRAPERSRCVPPRTRDDHATGGMRREHQRVSSLYSGGFHDRDYFAGDVQRIQSAS